MNFTGNFIQGIELSLFLEKIEFSLFAGVLFSLYILKEWKNAINIFFVFVVSYAAVLSLSILEIFTLEKSVITISISVFILIISCFNLFLNNNGTSRRKKSNYRKPLAGIAGVLCSFFVQLLLIGRANIANLNKLGNNLSLNIGVIVGCALLLLVFLFIGTIFTVTIGIKKKEWILFCSGACAGIVLFLFR